MKNAESFIVWTGNVYGDRDRCLDRRFLNEEY